MEPIIFNLDNHTIEIKITRKALCNPSDPLSVSIEGILTAVESLTGVTRKTIRSKVRPQHVVDARWAFVLSLSKAGFGNAAIRDALQWDDVHSVYYALNKGRDQYKNSIRFRALVDNVWAIASSCGTSLCQPQGIPSQQPSEQAFCPAI